MQWFTSHPWAWPLVYPAFVAFLTFTFNKHTDEEYAELPDGFAKFLKFCAATGVDVPKLLSIWRKP